MSVKHLVDKILTGVKNSKIPLPPVSEPTLWVRPNDWLSLPTVLNTEHKIVGLHAVYPGDSNFLAFTCNTSGGDYEVTWGDGTSNVYTNGAIAEHVYNFNNVTLDGTLTSENFKQVIVTVVPLTDQFNNFNFNVKHTLETTGGRNSGWLDIIVSGPTMTNLILGSGSNVSFYSLQQFQLISENLITNFSAFFFKCFALRSVPLFIANNCTNFTGMFERCYSLEYILPTTSTTGLHTNSGSIFYGMFSDCSNLKRLFSPTFNTSNGIDFTVMFSTCKRLIDIPDLNLESIPGPPLPVSNSDKRLYNSMFSNCFSLVGSKTLNLPNATEITYMFNNCQSLNNITLIFGPTTNRIEYMFQDCKNLTNVSILGTLTTLQYTHYMFYRCISLVNAPFFNTSSVISLSSMFEGCTSLKRVPKYDYSLVSSMGSMFKGCVSLEYVPPLDLPKVTNVSNLFEGCVSLKRGPEITFPTTVNLYSLIYFFYNCYSLRSVPNYTFSPSTTTLTSFFWNCYSLSEVPAFDLSKITNLDYMFYNCTSLDEIPLFTMPTVNCSAAYMFYSCISLKSIPNLDTNKLTNTSYMFQYCTNLSTVPLLNLSLVTSANYMFNNSGIKTIPALNLTSSTSNTGFANSSYSLSSSSVINTKASIDYSTCYLSKSSLEEIFNNLSPVSVARTITISNNFGAPTPITKTCGMTIGNSVMTAVSTVGIEVGMQVTGTGTPLSHISNAVTIIAGNLVQKVNHPLVNGDEISFYSLVSTNTVALNTIYYVVNANVDDFQIATTPGGTPLTLSPTGTGNIRYRCNVVAIIPNVSVTLSKPALAAGNNLLAFRHLTTGTSLLKGWTVTG